MDIVNHRLDTAIQWESPHQDARPDPEDISLIVVHGISLPAGHFGGDYIQRLFLGTLDCACHPDLRDLKGIRVSSHLLIRRDGRVAQFVPFDRRAWHAGESRYEGRERCNDFAIGIELEGVDDKPYSPAQYKTLVAVVQRLMEHYPVTGVCGHADIAPGRKTDPGAAFDWAGFRKRLATR